MLEGLNRIDWTKLIHAYGSAEDVPDQIRALSSEDAAICSNALELLQASILHQGTRYQATSYAVPFLYELLLAPDVAGKSGILMALVDIAVGYDADHLPQGIDPDSYLRTLETQAAGLSKADLLECEEYGIGPAVDADCYRTVADGALLFIDFLKSPVSDLRGLAAYALAWFPSIAGRSFDRIIYALEGETEEANAASMILSLGLLARNSSHRTDVLERYLDPQYDLAMRAAAAIALAHEPLQEAERNVLIEAIRRPDDTQRAIKGLKFNSGHLDGYCALTLVRFGKPSIGRAVDTLCETLEQNSPENIREIVRSLLYLTIPDPPLGLRSQSPLTPMQKQALTAIAHHGGWIDGSISDGSYQLLMNAYGLPLSQEELLRYLGK